MPRPHFPPKRPFPPAGPSRKPPRKGGASEREPVEPPRPKNLSGGAAAELEFGD